MAFSLGEQPLACIFDSGNTGIERKKLVVFTELELIETKIIDRFL